MCPPQCLIGATGKATGLVLRTLTDLRKIHCVVGAQNLRAFVTTGEGGKNLQQIRRLSLVPTESPQMVSNPFVLICYMDVLVSLFNMRYQHLVVLVYLVYSFSHSIQTIIVTIKGFNSMY